MAGRKFTAKVISKPTKSPEELEDERMQIKAEKDYNALMERSFGSALHATDEPPLPPVSPSDSTEK